jgi:hypothetical protein
MTAGLVGSAASNLYGDAAGVSSTSSGAKIIANAANQAVMGATPEQIAISAIGQIGANAAKESMKPPPVAPAVDESAAETARLARQNAALAAEAQLQKEAQAQAEAAENARAEAAAQAQAA